MGKRKRADSDLSEPEYDDDQEDSTPKQSKRGRKTKSEAPTPKESSPEQAMPTVAQLCEQYGLNDVDLEYSEADYSNLTTYKLFQQTFRQRIQAENPKVPVAKLMMLVGAKWREFIAQNEQGSEQQQEEEGSEQQQEEEDEEQEQDQDEEEDLPL